MNPLNPVRSASATTMPVTQPLLLATDLDGTFLAGDAAKRRQLYQLVKGHPGITLAWVTGRSFEAVQPLLSDPELPTPAYLICDVGATVIRTADMQPVQPLQAEIESRWPGEQAVLAAMARFTFLQRQPVPQQRRCSFHCEPEALAQWRDEIERAASNLQCEVLYSAGRYLDILPQQTDKGRTLQALVHQLGIDSGRVLVAGDTLNDLSMFVATMKGVCVGESEPALLAATAGFGNVLHSPLSGCGGILDAIEYFALIDTSDADPQLETGNVHGDAELVMVYHRLPYEEVVIDGKTVRRRHSSPNGIIPSLLSFFGDGHPGSWVAWSVEESKRGALARHTEVDAELYPNLRAARVALTKTEVDIFYKRFSKEAFWPIINNFWERARFNEEHWQIFKSINRRFAEVAAAEAAPGATVWLHDYNLWMVPSTLRELRPDLKIAFFHHTHFPTSDIFNIIPWRREIIGSLLACDYIGFHIPRHVENFVDTVRSAVPFRVSSRVACAPRFLTFGCAVGVETMAAELDLGERCVKLGAHPIGTDIDRIARCLEQTTTAAHISAIRRDVGPRKLVLSIERLDYGKGILEKLQAFERLFDAAPDLLGSVTLVMVCVPAAKEMTVYRTLQTQIEQAVGRINGRYSRMDWTPVHFFARPLPFEDVVAHYAAADVMWITPLRDGMNLVAKEFVATQGLCDGNGVLILSEFAGAAAELKGALLTNPHDHNDLVTVLQRALVMSKNEREYKQRALFDIVRHYDLARWGQDFLCAVRGEPVGDTKIPRRKTAAAL